MTYSKIITENRLDTWARSAILEAQGVIVELVYRLVAASSPNPNERRFPLSDSINQPGPDGFLETEFSFKPFVPEGRSIWEIGAGEKAGKKATDDYRERTAATPSEVRKDSTFIFVTPLSGRKDWPYTWKETAQADWVKRRIKRKEWRDVHVIDGTRLIDWLHYFPAVERWLAYQMGIPVQEIDTLDQCWANLRTIGDPPPLTPQLFLANRDEACNKLKEVLDGNSLRLQIDTHYPAQMADFISAYTATLEDSAKLDVAGRCLIVSGIDAWDTICELQDRHIIVANFPLDDTDSFYVRLLEKAKRAGHAVIFAGAPGGPQHPNRVPIPNPTNHQIREALEKAGYKEERARTLAQKSNGNLSSLLRLLLHLSATPEWAQGTDAAELAIAVILGTWVEHSEADKVVTEKLSGKAYGEWIGKMREIALRPGTPLAQRDGVWKIVSRYEGWYALGPRLFDEHLDRLREVAVSVLRERDPQFDLPSDERFAASLHGKVLTHSRQLRTGLAEGLALLGSHPKALTSCSFSKSEVVAILAVREILTEADWTLWAGLNDLLPLLAEAAPGEFLAAVENALNNDPCPFDMVFAQEGAGVMGNNYMTGLLWALETLAWDAEYLTQVVLLLGELAARDPDGMWANRPRNSLATILLPWLPQTGATVSQRQAAVATLLNDLPDVAWKLLLTLLPGSHQVSSGSRKPAWREMIADDWSRGVTHQEYWEQAAAYAELAISAAKQDVAKLAELIDRLDDLSLPARDQLLAYLRTDTIVSLPPTDRLRLWTELVDLVARHRKFPDTEWHIEPEALSEIEAIAKRLAPDAPIYRHQRLFSERDIDLYEERGNYEKQSKKLEDQRAKAVAEIFAAGGMAAVLEFAKAVESSWRVGAAFGTIAADEVESEVLPVLLESEIKSLSQFAGGYVWGKFRMQAWQWVDKTDMSQWSPSQKGLFLAYLPFISDTWERAALILGRDESPYWSKANANPYEAEEDLELAIDRLVEYGRAHAAIRCLDRLLEDKRPLNGKQAIRALQAEMLSSEDAYTIDVHAIVEIIKALQNDPNTNRDDLLQVEWAFLPLLDQHHGASPKLLERRLANEPAFFCDVIRTVFRSRKGERSVQEPTEQQKNIAENAYRLLSEWSTPPGSQKDGTFSSDALTTWLKEVKTSCAESGHLEVALTMVGHVLTHTPPDPDGLWLHHSVAIALNAKDAKEMRNGFHMALFNSRGVHHVDPESREERELAKKYRTQADEVDARGYYRLASTLRDLATFYEREVEQGASRFDPDD